MTTLTITKSSTYDLSNKKIEKLIVKANDTTITNLKMDNLTSKCVQLIGDNILLEKCSFNGNESCDMMLQVKGSKCRISNCLFERMNKKGVIIAVSVYKNKFSYCLIDNNNFRDCKEGDSNGWECIRIGDSKSSLYDSKSMIHNNFFASCDREIELISIKSCANVICFNKIIDCKSGIVLRHGRRNRVVNNYINGNHREGCCGIRICGKEHTIANNTIEGILNKDNPFRSAICIMNGEEDNKLNGYEAVKNTQIINNDFLSCEVAFSLGVHNKRGKQVLPQKILIEGNKVVKCLSVTNDNDKCLGLENSFMDNNDVMDRDVRIEIKNGRDLNKESVEEIFCVEEIFLSLYTDNEEEPETDTDIEMEERKEDPDTLSDFDDVLDEIIRLKLEEKNSKCEKCDDTIKTMNSMQDKSSKKIQSLEEEVERLKMRLNKITELLF